MHEVVIVEAVRSPDRPAEGRARRAPSGRSARASCSAPRSSVADRSGAPSARSSAAASRRWASSRSTSRARRGCRRAFPWRSPSTTIDSQCGSSQQATTLAAGLVGAGHRGPRPRLRRRDDDARAARLEHEGRAPAPAELSRALRLRDPVPGRRDDRQGVRHHARGHRPLRPPEPALATAAWREGRFTREIVPDRGAGARRGAASPTGERADGRARRGPARDVAREARGAEARRAGRRAHGRARRRRCRTARPRCCSPRPSARRRSAFARAPASSPRRSSASTR